MSTTPITDEFTKWWTEDQWTKGRWHSEDFTKHCFYGALDKGVIPEDIRLGVINLINQGNKLGRANSLNWMYTSDHEGWTAVIKKLREIENELATNA